MSWPCRSTRYFIHHLFTLRLQITILNKNVYYYLLLYIHVIIHFFYTSNAINTNLYKNNMLHVVKQITSPCGVLSIRLWPGTWSTFDCHDKISLILWHNKCILQHWNSYYNWLVALMLMIKPVQKGGQNKTHCCIYIQYSLPFWRLFQVLLRHFRSNVRVILAVTLWRHPTNLVQPTPPRGSVIARVVHNLNRLIWKKNVNNYSSYLQIHKTSIFA